MGGPRHPRCEAWRAAGRKVQCDAGEWEAALGAFFEAGSRAWPDLGLDPADFTAHLARAVEPGLASTSALAALSAEGLFIAAAVSSGVSGAAGAFEAAYFPGVRRAVRRLEGGAALEDEVEQQLRVSFFVRNAQGSLLRSYSGGGAVSSWLKVVAMREAQRLRKSHAEAVHRSDEELADFPAPGADPELGFLRAHYRTDFKAAFAEALATLDERQKNVLRMNLLEGLSIDEVGRVYAVHRATAARWISSAREQLVTEARRRLAERLKLESRELASLMGLVRSHLSISLSRGLARPR